MIREQARAGSSVCRDGQQSRHSAGCHTSDCRASSLGRSGYLFLTAPGPLALKQDSPLRVLDDVVEEKAGQALCFLRAVDMTLRSLLTLQLACLHHRLPEG